jgi:outer membrane protein assembly factor BamB
MKVRVSKGGTRVMLRTHVVGLVISLLLAGSLQAENWPGWRGPRLDGSSLEKHLPLKWTAKENIAWQATIPGIGHSSPIVFGDRVFVTTCLLKTEERVLLALDRRTGKELWSKVVMKTPLEPKHGLNSFSSSTPATDGKHVYVNFLRIRPNLTGEDYPKKPRVPIAKLKGMVPEMVLTCYTMGGDLVWQKAVGQFYSPHGFCSPPILYKNLVILNGDQDAEAYLVALDKTSGDQVWKTDRPHRTRSYCAPLILEAAGKMQMVLTGSETVTSYDPDTGNLLWLIDGPTEQYVASPVFTDNVLFLTAGFPTYHNMGIRLDGTGNVTKTHVLWHESKTKDRNASYVPSPIAYDKWFYMISDRGYLSCFEAKTGSRLWMEQLGTHHSASPVLAGGYIYMTDDDGITYVLKAGSAFEEVSRNPLGEKCFSSPAISHGQIFVRTTGHLWCVGAPARATAR